MPPARKGQQLRKVITAKAWNQLHKKEKRVGLLDSEELFYPSLKALGYDTNNTVLNRFSTVAILEPIYPPASNANIETDVNYDTLEVKISRDVTTTSSIGVTQSPSGKGLSTQVVLQGLTWALVNITDANATWADVDTGNKLKTSGSGRVKIIWKPTGTGIKLCFVGILGGGGNVGVKFFRLQEDAATTRREIYAFELNDDGTLESEYVPIYDRFNWLLLAKVEQQVMALWDPIKSRWTFLPGHCPVSNSSHNNNAAINSVYVSGGVSQDSPNGTVGTAYSHTITTTNILANPVVTQLPPGISATWVGGNATITLTGTPTQAGTYYVKIVGTATGNAVNDFRTRLVKVVINV